MSTPAPQPGTPPHLPATAALPPRATPPPEPRKREIVIISHCTLFYWWPVWAVGFLMGILSLVGGQVMVTVPAGTTARGNVTVPELEGPRDVLVLPKDKHLPKEKNNADKFEEPHLHTSNNKNLGVL